MTELMIEKVALAIWQTRMNTQDGKDVFDHLSARQDWIECAKAAIGAMRDPSAAMRNAVAANWGRRTWSDYNDVINAALNEKQS